MFDAAAKSRALAKLTPLHSIPQLVEVIAWAKPTGCRSRLYHDHAAHVQLAQASQRVGRASEAQVGEPVAYVPPRRFGPLDSRVS